MEWTKKHFAALGAGLFTLAVIGGTTEDSSTGDAGRAAAAAGEAAATPVPTARPSLRLSVPADRTVYRDDVTVTGRVYASNGGNTKGVRVEVAGRPAVVKDGVWRRSVRVKRGDNDVDVVASKGDYEEADGSTTLTRRSSQAELAAARAARARARAARMQRYIAAAGTIPYNQLKKNADRHAGERVKFTGQIFQIQESYDSTVILLSVTDEGYGFWTDNVWVDYPGTIKSAEDDVITVYGTIEGSKSYETQIGGETYVPQMTAKYVLE